MSALIQRLASSVRRLSPASILAIGLAYVLGLAFVDHLTPAGLSMSLFYLLAVAFVAWGAGKWQALVVATAATVLVAIVDWPLIPTASRITITLWNAATRFLIFSAAAWLVAEVTRITRHLTKLVEERTAQYRAILATAMDGFAVIAPTGHITDVNEAYCRMLGFRREELVGLHICQVEAKDSPADVARRMAELVRTGGERFETRQRHKNGGVVDIEVSISCPAGAQGPLIAFTRDITQRQRAQEALRESEERYRSLAESSPDSIFIIDRQVQIQYANSAAATLCGRPPKDLIGVPQIGLFPPDIAQHHNQLALRVFETGAPLRLDESLTFATGERWIETRLVPVHGSGQEVTSVIVICVDITERKRLERQLLEISDREQAHIGQEIHDGLCQQLVSLAFDANALERQLASEVHPAAPRARRIVDYLDQAITEARHLSRGLFPIRLAATGLPSALEELARTTASRFQICCQFTCSEGVEIDNNATATHLYRIAQEAVTNAIKHGQTKTISIRLTVQGQQLELSIQDDGKGFPPELRGKGTGMGLHIMDYRARTIGGSLSLHAGPIRGATVCCCFPLPARLTIAAREPSSPTGLQSAQAHSHFIGR